MKRFALTLILTILPSTAFGATVPPHFVLTGSGYGHGVGMSQIGVEGQAMEGQSAQYILNYWFPGTQIVSVPDTQLIRVNIAHQVSSATIAIAAGFPHSNIDLTSNPDGSQNNGGLGVSNSIYKFSLVGKKITAAMYNKGLPTLPYAAQNLWTLY